MRILISAGTDHHPFDRLVGWAQRWARSHPEDHVVVQHGTAAAPTDCATVSPLLPRAEMLEQMQAAEVVVVSCGPGAVMDVRSGGRRPIVVPRRAELGEHVDDHQETFATHLESEGLAFAVRDESQFVALLDALGDDPARLRLDDDDQGGSGIDVAGELIDELVWGPPPDDRRGPPPG